MHSRGASLSHRQGISITHSKCAFVYRVSTKSGAFLLGVVV
jgi:hypothetical protein